MSQIKQLLPATLEEAQEVATQLGRSKWFGVSTPAEALTKVLVGAEVGLPPAAAMRSIHIVEGKPEFSAALMAKLIRESGTYDYRYEERTDERCTVVVERKRDGQWRDLHPPITWDLERARRAGLSFETRKGAPGMYSKYPRAMLSARALSEAFRAHCPELGMGAEYVDGELSWHNATDLDTYRVEVAKEPTPAPKREAEVVEVEEEPEPSPPSPPSPPSEAKQAIEAPDGQDPHFVTVASFPPPPAWDWQEDDHGRDFFELATPTGHTCRIYAHRGYQTDDAWQNAHKRFRAACSQHGAAGDARRVFAERMRVQHGVTSLKQIHGSVLAKAEGRLLEIAKGGPIVWGGALQQARAAMGTPAGRLDAVAREKAALLKLAPGRSEEPAECCGSSKLDYSQTIAVNGALWGPVYCSDCGAFVGLANQEGGA